MPEWLKGTDCKSVGIRLRWFKSSSAQALFYFTALINNESYLFVKLLEQELISLLPHALLLALLVRTKLRFVSACLASALRSKTSSEASDILRKQGISEAIPSTIHQHGIASAISRVPRSLALLASQSEALARHERGNT